MEDRDNYLRLESKIEAFDARFARFEKQFDGYLAGQTLAVERLVRMEEQTLQTVNRYKELTESYRHCVVQNEDLSKEVTDLKVKVGQDHTTMKMSERLVWSIGSVILAVVTAVISKARGFG